MANPNGNEPALSQPIDNSPGIKREWDIVNAGRAAAERRLRERAEWERRRRLEIAAGNWHAEDAAAERNARRHWAGRDLSQARRSEADTHLHVRWQGERPFVPPMVLYRAKETCCEHFPAADWYTTPLILWGDWLIPERREAYFPLWEDDRARFDRINWSSLSEMQPSPETVRFAFDFTITFFDMQYRWLVGFGPRARVLAGCLWSRIPVRYEYTGVNVDF